MSDFVSHLPSRLRIAARMAALLTFCAVGALALAAFLTVVLSLVFHFFTGALRPDVSNIDWLGAIASSLLGLFLLLVAISFPWFAISRWYYGRKSTSAHGMVSAISGGLLGGFLGTWAASLAAFLFDRLFQFGQPGSLIVVLFFLGWNIGMVIGMVLGLRWSRRRSPAAGAGPEEKAVGPAD